MVVVGLILALAILLVPPVAAMKSMKNMENVGPNAFPIKLQLGQYGRYFAKVSIADSNVDCVVDTGSRHLVISALALPPDVGDIFSPKGEQVTGPPTLYYGTQTDYVNWRRATVDIAGYRRDATFAVTQKRTCQHSGCFNVLGLAAPHRGAGLPFLRQILPGTPAMTIDFGRNPYLHLGAAKSSSNWFPLIDHGHWFVLGLHGTYVRRRDGTHTQIADATQLMLDTGSNMLGCNPATKEAMETGLADGDDLVLLLHDTMGLEIPYVVPSHMYRHRDGSLLVDAHHAQDKMLVLGALFMRDRRFSFDVARGRVGISPA